MGIFRFVVKSKSIKAAGIAHRADKRRGAVAAVALAVAIAAAAGVAVQGAYYPVGDNAMFEYIGRALVRGAALYYDVWDNKLPPIYLVNSMWNALFGSAYPLHTMAETGVAVTSALLLGALMDGFGLTSPFWAVAGLAVLLCVICPLNSTEAYALPSILGAALASRYKKVVLSAILLTAAGSFWLPSLLSALPVGYVLRRENLAIFCFVLTAGLALFSSAVLLAYGWNESMTLLHSWVAYVRPDSVDVHHRIALLNRLNVPYQAASNFAAGAVQSGAAPLLVLLLAALRKPATEAQRFALLWSVAAFAGTCVGIRFFVQYFMLVLPALLFALGAFTPQRLRFKHVAAVFLAALLALRTTVDAYAFWSGASRQSAITRRISTALAPVAADTLSIETDWYEPGLYLAIQPKLRSPYEIAAPPNSRFARFLSLGNHAAKITIVVRDGLHAGIRVCRRTAWPWRVYATPHVAILLRLCP